MINLYLSSGSLDALKPGKDERRYFVMSKWIEKTVPCKIGTIPTLARLHGKSVLKVGNWIKIQEMENGPWNDVLVTRVDADGYFMADR